MLDLGEGFFGDVFKTHILHERDGREARERLGKRLEK